VHRIDELALKWILIIPRYSLTLLYHIALMSNSECTRNIGTTGGIACSRWISKAAMVLSYDPLVPRNACKYQQGMVEFCYAINPKTVFLSVQR
jgi:hypothetical protein